MPADLLAQDAVRHAVRFHAALGRAAFQRDVVALLVEAVEAVLHPHLFGLHLLEAGSTSVLGRASHVGDDDLRAAEAAVQTVLASGAPVYADDFELGEQGPSSLLLADVRTLLAVPLLARGRPKGVVYCMRIGARYSMLHRVLLRESRLTRRAPSSPDPWPAAPRVTLVLSGGLATEDALPAATHSRDAAAVQSMFRVRVAESPPGEDGLRRVWHQGGEGADLTTLVDPQGRVARMEFTLFETHVVWTAEGGFSTGTVDADKAAGGIKGSEVVRRDPEVNRATIERMHAALAGYSGQDRYLLHLKTLIGRLREGLTSFSDEAVTSVTERKRPSDARPQPAQKSWVGFLALGVGVGLAVVAAAVPAPALTQPARRCSTWSGSTGFTSCTARPESASAEARPGWQETVTSRVRGLISSISESRSSPRSAVMYWFTSARATWPVRRCASASSRLPASSTSMPSRRSPMARARRKGTSSSTRRIRSRLERAGSGMARTRLSSGRTRPLDKENAKCSSMLKRRGGDRLQPRTLHFASEGGCILRARGLTCASSWNSYDRVARGLSVLAEAFRHCNAG